MIIIDTNLYVSYALFRTGTLGQRIHHILESHLYAFSKQTMSELTEVLMRSKFDRYMSSEVRLKILRAIASDAEWFTPTETIHDCRDPKDNKFLELAAASRADFLITGDDDLLVLHPFRQTHILTLSAFAEQHLSK
ncbi:putative toxin-antitoxin system toxin component, PIN family [Coraliomargarita sp. SDUM461004]|uniref:Toxin-antitoxin system toxin component, PIN family n=1 Tax=Thalassobacterium sedimentorum TaxID=3041258 RepID=A0ABU1ALN1_9BACT|nr:putative toxin-antitoxin system toxin component, PIN family [Coraliomargarita sp. SDUM461004]MDQ8195714.1 putative toxin-antitoxin system toxin component, PIN family [Coraliomargarita sp. SDUM461004]